MIAPIATGHNRPGAGRGQGSKISCVPEERNVVRGRRFQRSNVVNKVLGGCRTDFVRSNQLCDPTQREWADTAKKPRVSH